MLNTNTEDNERQNLLESLHKLAKPLFSKGQKFLQEASKALMEEGLAVPAGMSINLTQSPKSGIQRLSLHLNVADTCFGRWITTQCPDFFDTVEKALQTNIVTLDLYRRRNTPLTRTGVIQVQMNLTEPDPAKAIEFLKYRATSSMSLRQGYEPYMDREAPRVLQRKLDGLGIAE